MRVRHVLLALGGALGVLIVATSTAAPASADGTRTYRDLATGFCLDSNTNGDVYTMGCNGGSFQKWVQGS